jgi:hypothetical protein
MQEDRVQRLYNEKSALLNYFKSIFPVFHNSNVFSRDFQNAIQKFLELKGEKISYAEAEALTSKLSERFEAEQLFVRVNQIGWKLNYEPFRTGAPHTFELEKKEA